MTRFEKSNIFLIIGFISLLVLFVFITSINTLIPSRDSGVFLYAGRQVLKGDIPYRDFWDHKTPLIYYINAFAVSIFNGDLWGLWLIEGIFLFIFFTFLYQVIRKSTNYLFAIFALIFSTVIIGRFLEGGNRVEEYALVFQAASVFLLSKINSIKDIKRAKRFYFLLGVLFSMLFLLKPNLIAISFAVIVYASMKKRFLDNLKPILFGFTSIIILTTLYFWVNDALNDLIDQTIRFNIIYSKSSIYDKFDSIKNGFALYGAVVIFTFLGELHAIKNYKKVPGVVGLACIWWPVEVFVAGWSGRDYHQYYLPILIPTLILSTYILYIAFGFLFKKFRKRTKNVLIAISLFMIILLGYKGAVIDIVNTLDDRKPFDRNLNFRSFLFNSFHEHTDTIDTIQRETNDDDTVLIWGSEPSILYITKRDSPGRYFYQYRLFFPDYDTNGEKVDELINDIKANVPKLIIDASKSTIDQDVSYVQAMPPLDPEGMEKWLSLMNFDRKESLLDFHEFLEVEYELLNLTYDGKWGVYKRAN